MDRGLKILLDLYKGPNWNEIPVSEEDLSFAKEKGYLFDPPAPETHTDTLNRRHAILAQIDPREIANAFLYSLSTRKLEYRSALGSYYYAQAVPEHDFMKSHNIFLAAAVAAAHCYFCGWTAPKTEPNKSDIRSRYNFYNMLRYKYGGSPIGDININYALFDLEQFIKLPKVAPAEEDKRILMEILSCVDRLNGADKAGKLRDTILKAKKFKSNQDEVSVLLGELGICGILASNEFPSYDSYFANEYERDPVEYRNYFAYPVNRWHAKDGINYEKLNAVLGLTLNP